MPFGLGVWEMLLILLACLLLFGAKRLPEIGTSLGKGIREFKSSIREVESSVRVDAEVAPPREDKPLAREAEGAEEEAPRRLTTS